MEKGRTRSKEELLYGNAVNVTMGIAPRDQGSFDQLQSEKYTEAQLEKKVPSGGARYAMVGAMLRDARGRFVKVVDPEYGDRINPTVERAKREMARQKLGFFAVARVEIDAANRALKEESLQERS